jgi:hypothetical protein
MPEDVATGLTLTLAKNIPPSAGEITVPMVTTSDKPQVVKLKIRSEGERQFWTSGQPRKAIHYVIHVDIGGLKGAIAPIMASSLPILMYGYSAATLPASSSLRERSMKVAQSGRSISHR